MTPAEGCETVRKSGSIWPVVAMLAALAVLVPDGALAARDSSGYDWFWVFYEKDSNERYSSIVYRPFFMRNSYSRGSSFEASLMPLVYWRYSRPGSSEWKSLFGLVDSMDYRHRDGTPDYDFGAFPLLFYGDSTDERDRYFMMLPFGGTVKGKLAQDRISAYIFPGFLLFFVYPPGFNLTTALILIASLVPVWADYEAKDYKAWGVLWPLIQRGTSPDRDDFRVLPFYAHNYKKDVYDNYSYMLLANFQNVYMKNDVQRTRFIFPFYGRRWNESGSAGASTLFWPLFSWGYNRKAGDFELNFPWPLVMIQDSKNPSIYKRIFFPFYGKYVYEKKETFFITPLYFSMKNETRALISESYYNALIIWYFKRDYRGAPDSQYGKSWRYFKIWPLLHYERDDRGNASFNLLSLLPFRDPEGYEMLYQPFWTIFEYRALASGESRVGLLLRLYYQVWGSDYLHIKIPLLLSYSRDKDELTNVSFLLSMFGYTRDVRGARLRLFWIPVTLWKTESPVENAREANTPEAYNRGRGAFGEAELFQALSCGISFLPVEYYPGLLGTFPRFSGSYLREAGEDGFVTMDYLNYSKRVF